MPTRRQYVTTQQETVLTYEKPVIPQVVQLALPFESRVKLEVCAGGDHTLPFVSNGDTICLGTFQQRKSAASRLWRWDAESCRAGRRVSLGPAAHPLNHCPLKGQLWLMQLNDHQPSKHDTKIPEPGKESSTDIY